jgi:hypothetical protein
MADDEFDIDIYGDTNGEQEQEGSFKKDEEGDMKIDGIESTVENSAGANGTEIIGKKCGDGGDDDDVDVQVSSESDKMNGQQQIKSTDESGRDVLSIPRQAPQQQGIKRKEGSDDRLIDPGATTALMISELHWWNTDDDIRGWVNQAMVEDELKEITFSEHKVNGKSKGFVPQSLLVLGHLPNHCATDKPTLNLPRNKLQRLPNTRSMLSAKVSNMSRNIQLRIPIQMSTRSGHCQKTPPHVHQKIRKTIGDRATTLTTAVEVISVETFEHEHLATTPTEAA